MVQGAVAVPPEPPRVVEPALAHARTTPPGPVTVQVTEPTGVMPSTPTMVSVKLKLPPVTVEAVTLSLATLEVVVVVPTVGESVVEVEPWELGSPPQTAEALY